MMPQPDTVIPTEPLTDREIEILHALAAGASNAEIGGKLHLTEGTVKWYNRRIFDKLGAKNRAEAVRLFGELGKTSLPNIAPLAVALMQPTKINTNLPEVAMIGREHEHADLRDWVNERRLVTILGQGGIGKSTLAVAVGHAVQTAFQDGVWYVSLVGLTHPDEINPAIAAAIGLARGGNSVPVEHLLLYLSDKHTLLVIDNFDMLIEGAAHIQRILAAAPHVHILITSRERLNLSDETLMRLNGLSLTQSPKKLLSAASTLFFQHAQRSQPKLQPDAPTLSLIHKICQAVEGLPLAIILAASWVDTLSLSDIAAEVTRNLDILSTELRDVPARHRNMRHVLDQTWERLSSDEKQVYAALAVFRGGFDRVAAQVVAGANLRTLNGLMAKSLIQRDGERYTMHELLRQYAEQCLTTTAKTMAREAHARHYLQALANESQPEQDFDNVRAAWQYASIAHHALLNPTQLSRYCERLGRFADAVGLCGVALDHTQDANLKAHLRFARGNAHNVMSELALTIADFEGILQLADASRVALNPILVMARLGDARRRNGELNRAIEVLSRALALAQDTGNAELEAEISFYLGWAYDYGKNVDTASILFNKAFELTQTHGLTGLAAVLGRYASGVAHLDAWHLRKAAQQFEAAYELAIRYGISHYACEGLEMAAHCYICLGEFSQARIAFERSLDIAHQGNMYWMQSATYAPYGFACAALGDYALGWRNICKGMELAKKLKLSRFMNISMLFLATWYLDLGLVKEAEHVALHHVITNPSYYNELSLLGILAYSRRFPQGDPALEGLSDKIFAAMSDFAQFRESETLNAVCEIEAKRRDFAKIAQYAQRLLDIGIQDDNLMAGCCGNHWQGVVMLANGAATEGVEKLKTALKYAQDMGYIARQIIEHRALQTAYQLLGDTTTASFQAQTADSLVAKIAANLAEYPELRTGLPLL